ncbi:MAG: MotA/TolQ/ExbB proton channel family protein [Puniceicoccales bacterium]|jgi:biopolymer transport protein ExbB|nr:MotA/TolQ/ExbB proton channel family protein [Puniceicoccales bacterium]
MGKNLIEGAGLFIYPLGACSLLAVFLFIERLVALRDARVLPAALLRFLNKNGVSAPLPPAVAGSSGGKVVGFFQRENPDAEALKAYTQIELTRLERGLFLLDIIVGVAPLIGLLGTVYGLFVLFPESGMPNAATLTHGVGMALTTTILGLLIAIPALFASGWFGRRLEIVSARMNLLVERLISNAGALTGGGTGGDTSVASTTEPAGSEVESAGTGDAEPTEPAGTEPANPAAGDAAAASTEPAASAVPGPALSGWHQPPRLRFASTRPNSSKRRRSTPPPPALFKPPQKPEIITPQTGARGFRSPAAQPPAASPAAAQPLSEAAGDLSGVPPAITAPIVVGGPGAADSPPAGNGVFVNTKLASILAPN